MIARHAISGQALVRSYVSLPFTNVRTIAWLSASRHLLTSVSLLFNRDNTILSDPKIVEVVISILSERGYAVTMDERVHETPKRVDPKTFEIILER